MVNTSFNTRFIDNYTRLSSTSSNSSPKIGMSSSEGSYWSLFSSGSSSSTLSINGMSFWVLYIPNLFGRDKAAASFSWSMMSCGMMTNSLLPSSFGFTSAHFLAAMSNISGCVKIHNKSFCYRLGAISKLISYYLISLRRSLPRISCLFQQFFYPIHV